ncbi:MAG: hypothetical protein Kow0047_17390 [Anaerolineae bacterium]
MAERTVLSRREFLRAASLVSAGALLAACGAPAPGGEQQPAAGGEAQPEGAGEEPITVRLWVAWGNMNKLFQDEVWYGLPEYEEICGNIKIEYKGNTGDEAVLTAIAAGDPPEAASNISYAQLAIKGVFLDCQPLVDASKYVHEEDFIPAIWDFCKFWTFDGLLGVPAFESFLDYGLNYNAELVQKAGLDPDNPPQTFSEALEWHKALTIKDEAGNLQQFGLDPYDAMGGDPDGMQVACNHKYWDDETGKFDFTNELFVEYFDITKKFYDVMGPDQIAGLRQAEGMGGWGGAYNAEAQAMIIEGYWHPGETTVQAPDVAKKNRASWTLVLDSLRGHKIQVAGGHTFAIFKKSKHPTEAFKLAEFFLTDAALDILFKQVGWIVGKKAWVEKIDPSTYPGLEFYFRSAEEATDWYQLRRCPLHGFLWDQLGEVREMMYRGVISPREAAEEMQKRAETEWKNQGLPMT